MSPSFWTAVNADAHLFRVTRSQMPPVVNNRGYLAIVWCTSFLQACVKEPLQPMQNIRPVLQIDNPSHWDLPTAEPSTQLCSYNSNAGFSYVSEKHSERYAARQLSGRKHGMGKQTSIRI